MATKTAMKSTRKGLVAKLEVTLTADLLDHALAYCCTWQQGTRGGCFALPVWARTKVATLRGLLPVIASEGLKFFERSTWRDQLTQDEARECLALARKLRAKFFPELAGD